MALPVVAALTVGLVVALVVGDQVVQGEAVVRGHEVDRRDRGATGVLVQVGAARQARAELAQHAGLGAVEVAHRVAVAAVPLGPQGREAAHLVAALAQVPRLGDQLHLGDDRVLLDDVEERREAVHLVQLAGQGGGQVEAEAVHVHLGDPVAQRVHDQLQHVRGAHEQGVAGAGRVVVMGLVLLHQAVVGGVVDAAEAQGGAHVVALGGVVVDHVEDHLDVRLVEVLHHLLELLDLLTGVTGVGVLVVGGEEADGVVAPVVAQALLHQVAVLDELVHRHQLHGGDAEGLQVLDDRGVAHRHVGAADRLVDVRVLHGQALDVGLVDDGVVVLVGRRVVVAPVEVGGDHHGVHGVRGRVLGVALGRVLEIVAVQRGVVGGHPGDRLGVRVQQQLAGIAALPIGGIEGAVHAVAVPLPGLHRWQVDVPHVGVHLGHLDAALRAVLVEQAQFDAISGFGEEGEIGA